METFDITSMSSRGQIVIPQEIREQLHISIGEKFAVSGHGDVILLKRITSNNIDGFEKLLSDIRKHVKKASITPKDVEEAIKQVRSRH